MYSILYIDMYVQYGVHFIAAGVSIDVSLLHILSTREQSNLADSHNLPACVEKSDIFFSLGYG